MNPGITKSDILIIGSGVAGLSCAIYIQKDISVNLVTKQEIGDSATANAQGGIA